MKTKICSTCKEVKLLEEFYKNKCRKDGYSNECKKCNLEKCKVYRKKNLERLIEYKRKHYLANKEDYKIKRIKYYEENKEHLKKCHKEYIKKNKKKYKYTNKKKYFKSLELKNKDVLHKKKWNEKNKNKIKIYNILNKSIKNKKIIKPNKCSYCDIIGRIEGHHEDYSKPLEVIWLCSSCHRNVHAGNIVLKTK